MKEIEKDLHLALNLLEFYVHPETSDKRMVLENYPWSKMASVIRLLEKYENRRNL